jgi:hypothetical protein
MLKYIVPHDSTCFYIHRLGGFILRASREVTGACDISILKIYDGVAVTVPAVDLYSVASVIQYK